MEFNYSYYQKNFNSSFTRSEDDNVKVYYVDLQDEDHKKLLGDQLMIIFSKMNNEYEPPHYRNENARELAGFISVAIEQFEKNKA